MSPRQVVAIGFVILLGLLGVVSPGVLIQPAFAHEMHEMHTPQVSSSATPESLFLNPEQDLLAEQLFTQGLDKLQVDDYQGAMADFDRSLELAHDQKVYLRRGELRHQLGDLQGALVDYTEVLNLEPNTYTYYQRGHIREALGDLQGALADYTEAINLYPNDGYGYSYRGALQTRMGNILAASQDLSLALQYNSDRPEAYFYRGVLREKLGNDLGAVSDYQRSAILFSEQGKLVRAKEAFDSAARLQLKFTATK
jgi:tetratricopeptide (TPR) repeat protein